MNEHTYKIRIWTAFICAVAVFILFQPYPWTIRILAAALSYGVLGMIATETATLPKAIPCFIAVLALPVLTSGWKVSNDVAFLVATVLMCIAYVPICKELSARRSIPRQKAYWIATWLAFGTFSGICLLMFLLNKLPALGMTGLLGFGFIAALISVRALGSASDDGTGGT